MRTFQGCCRPGRASTLGGVLPGGDGGGTVAAAARVVGHAWVWAVTSRPGGALAAEEQQVVVGGVVAMYRSACVVPVAGCQLVLGEGLCTGWGYVVVGVVLVGVPELTSYPHMAYHVHVPCTSAWLVALPCCPHHAHPKPKYQGS